MCSVTFWVMDVERNVAVTVDVPTVGTGAGGRALMLPPRSLWFRELEAGLTQRGQGSIYQSVNRFLVVVSPSIIIVP